MVQIQKDVLAMGDSEMDEDTKAVAGNAVGKRLSIKGGVFRKFVGGKEVAKIEDRHMNIIFVKMSHTPSRNFYDQVYKEGESIAPACWSSDTQTPDAGVASPKAKRCNECPKSVQGSGTDGNGTACRLSWRTAVVLPNDPGGDVLQLVLPSTSAFAKEDSGKWGFRPYIQMLVANGVTSAGRVITKMQFDTDSATPKVMFSPLGAVPPQDIATIYAQSRSKEAEDAVKMVVYKVKEAAAAPAAPKLPTGEVSQESLKGLEEQIQNIPDPVLRESKKKTGDTNAAPAEDMGEIIKKWANKK
jgi:hypothetical protein